MIISKSDFSDYVIQEQLASARHTTLSMVVNAMTGQVRYEVKTKLQITSFALEMEITDEMRHYSFYRASFEELDKAITAFNDIQKLAEERKLVMVTGM